MVKQCRICGKDFETILYGGSRQFCFNCVPQTEDLGQRTNFKRQAMKKEGVKLLGNKCLKCGEERYYLLDFHHLDSSEKDAEPARLIANSKIEDFFSEIKKCVLLCSNCHRELHWQESQGTTMDSLEKHKLDDNISRTCSYKELTCSECNKPVTKDSKTGLCPDCYHFSTRVVKERPSPELLVKEIQESSMLAVGRKYGVSDTAIRKWLKGYGLPTSSKEIKKLKMGE